MRYGKRDWLRVGVFALLASMGPQRLVATAAVPQAAPQAVSADPNHGVQTQSHGVRPRLFFTPLKVEQLQQRIEQDDDARAAWLRIRQRADRQLTEELVSKEYAEGGTGQHGNYGRPGGQIANMASTLGLAYRMTANPAYAQKLKEALLHYGELRRWAGDAGHTPPWHSELNTARFCFGYAVGYDCVHDFLSDAERASIAQSMIRLGILPTLNDWVLGAERIHALDSMGHNWWSVCVSMAGLAALSLRGDEPRAESWVQEVSNAFPEWFYYRGNILQNKSLNFDRQGAFYESVNYADYALSEYLLFRLACTNVLGSAEIPDIPLLRTVGDFFVQTSYPTDDSLLSVNFGDSSLHASGARTLQLLLANGYDTEAYRWYLTRTDPKPDDPIALLYAGTQPVPQPPRDLPQSVLYPDIGWAVLRSSWENDATLLAVKSGFTWNHAHPDAGSFVLFHAGRPVIIDSGTCSYSRPEYTSYYRQSQAHNVVLLDGAAQNPEDCSRGDRGVTTPGQLHHLLDMAGLRYVLADATGPTAWKFSRNYRHFLWLEGVILIVDDVRTYEPGRLEWLLHHEGTFRQDGTVLTLANGDTQVAVHPLFPENMQVVQKTGLRDHDPDTKVLYLALTPQDTGREAKFITAVVPMPKDNKQPLPRIETLRAENALGVRIRNDLTVTDIWLNLMADGRRMHRNSNNVIDGWDTDAYLLALTRPAGAAGNPDSLTRCFVACGSYLRKDGKVVLQSLSKVYTVFTCRNQKMEVALQGQPLVRAHLRTLEEPHTVHLNGEPVDFAYDATKQTLRLQLSNGSGEHTPTCDTAAENRMRIVKTDEGYQFLEAEAPVLFYRTAPKATEEGKYSRANYCHPVYGLDGQVLTEDFPKDHPHHRGIFWAWHQVYVGDTPLGDMWACEDFTWDIRTVEILPAHPNTAALKARVYWKFSRWKDGREPLARETVTIRVHQVGSDIRLIDFDIEILALAEGLRLGGSNDVKGYGGFSTRIMLPTDIQMSDRKGPVIPRETAVAAGDWMNFSGTFGRTASNFAILVHPANPGHPRQWILRSSGSAQNVAYPGREPIVVSTVKPLVLRYRLVLHKNADLNQLAGDYGRMTAQDIR